MNFYLQNDCKPWRQSYENSLAQGPRLPWILAYTTPCPGLVRRTFRFTVMRPSFNALHVKVLICHGLKLGEHIDLTMQFQNCKFSVQVKIIYISKNKNKITLKIVRCTGGFKAAMGQLLFETLQYSPKNLYKFGFPVRSISEGVHFKVLNSEREYLEVLSLRKQSYCEGSVDSLDKNMFDQYDADAIIVIAMHHKKIVGSLRILQSSTNFSNLEHQRFISLHDFFSVDEQVLEITRVCTAHDYRHGDLLARLFQFTARIAISLNCTTILGSATPSLLPLYKKLGFIAMPHTYSHPLLDKKQHRLIFAKKNDLLIGKRVHPFFWSKVYKDVYSYAKTVGLLNKQSAITRMRILYFAAASTLGLILHNVQNFLYRRRFRLKNRKNY